MEKIFETTAYHKASRKAVLEAVDCQRFHISENRDRRENDKLWLGDGIYFWQRYSDALYWRGRGYEEEYDIAVADLRSSAEQFLDLDTNTGIRALADFWNQFQEDAKERETYYEFQRNKDVIAICCQVYKKFNSVLLIRYSFPEVSNRPQYCATNNDAIQNVRRYKRREREDTYYV